MWFLRGDGPEILLDQAFEDTVAQDDSSFSSGATSTSVAAAQSRCANYLIFSRKGLPADAFTRASTSAAPLEPIIIDRASFQSTLPTAPAPPCLEIVPWKPVSHTLALQLLPAFIESRHAAEAQAISAPVILLGDVSRAQQHGLGDSDPSDFEFEAEQS